MKLKKKTFIRLCVCLSIVASFGTKQRVCAIKLLANTYESLLGMYMAHAANVFLIFVYDTIEHWKFSKFLLNSQFFFLLQTYWPIQPKFSMQASLAIMYLMP